MLNDAMDQVVLVKGWKKGAYWSFPRGKINKDEKDLDCAVREVYEETGFDILGAGLVGKEEEMKFIEVTMREQHMRLYVFRGVPMDTHFEPRTRKEISKIQWYKLSDLPTIKKVKTQQEGRGEDLATNANKFYMVAPFLVPLKKWIAQQKKQDTIRGPHGDQPPPPEVTDGVTTEDEPAADIYGRQPVAGDIDRLLNHLRQSSQRHTPSDLPEVSIHQTPDSAVSTQLKRMLNVKEISPPTNHATRESGANNHDTARSNSLLALLRGEATTTATGGTYNRPPPPTPFEAITPDPPMPQPAHQHHPRSLPLANIPPPPSFAIPPDNADHRSARYPMEQVPRPSGTNSVPYPNLGQASGNQHVAPSPQYPAQQARLPAAMALPFINNLSYGPTVLPVPQQSQDIPAHHHRNGDPQYSLWPQVQNFHAPVVPPASKLPLPQLNSHSLALLNAFRQEKVEELAVAERSMPAQDASMPEMKPDCTDQVRRDSVQERHVWESHGTLHETTEKMEKLSGTTVKISDRPSAFNTAPAGPHKNGFGPLQGINTSMNTKHAASVDMLNRTSTSDAKPRSHHQDALLNLFRKPSGPAPQVSRSSLSASLVPSGPVELSAQPSSTSAVEPTRRHQNNPARPVIDTNVDVPSAPVSAKKKRLQDAPVSATVTGPLNIPQFEVAARKLKETPVKANNDIPSGVEPSQRYTTSPVSILRRPKTTHNETRDTAVAKERRRVTASPQKPAEQRAKPSPGTLPRPFQPQILRRPAQAPQQSPLATSSVAPVAPVATLQQAITIDRGIEPKQNKQSEPSLGNKLAHMDSVGPPASNSTGAPLQAAPAHIDTTHVTPVRSGIGSVFSSGEDASSKPGSPMTPNDRSFLLGYLQGVAKGERR